MAVSRTNITRAFAVYSSSQMSVGDARPRSSPQTRRAALPFATAILCASLLGLGLAYFACALLIDGSSASFWPTSVICFGGSSSNPPQAARTHE